MATLPLLDKQVDLTFTRNDGSTLVLPTPPRGRKGGIRINGTFVAKLVTMDIEVRIWNFTTDVPLSTYVNGGIKITAGYRGTPRTTIGGTVVNSYRETPGPDGVTVFHMIVGIGEDWVTTPISRTYVAGQALRNVLEDVSGVLGLDLKYYADPSLALPIGVCWNGMAKNLLDKIGDMFKSYDTSTQFTGLRIVPFGTDLYVYRGDQGTGIVHELHYIAHAMHVGRGVDVQGAWVPTLRPGDLVKIDPRYFRQDISGAVSGAPGNQFQVFQIEFAFATDTEENMMTLLTVGTQAPAPAQAAT